MAGRRTNKQKGMNISEAEIFKIAPEAMNLKQIKTLMKTAEKLKGQFVEFLPPVRTSAPANYSYSSPTPTTPPIEGYSSSGSTVDLAPSTNARGFGVMDTSDPDYPAVEPYIPESAFENLAAQSTLDNSET